jgi:hypothetical protein
MAAPFAGSGTGSCAVGMDVVSGTTYFYVKTNADVKKQYLCERRLIQPPLVP